MDRDLKICRLRERGATLQSIGDMFNLTRERVRQIVKKYNIEKPKDNIIKEKIPYCIKTKNRLLKYVKYLDSGCWEFTKTKTKTGYGRISYCGKGQYAHRVSYELFNNIKLENNGRNTSETICVLHICNNRSCVNPDHLYLGTQEDNAKDRSIDNKKIL